MYDNGDNVVNKIGEHKRVCGKTSDKKQKKKTQTKFYGFLPICTMPYGCENYEQKKGRLQVTGIDFLTCLK